MNSSGQIKTKPVQFEIGLGLDWAVHLGASIPLDPPRLRQNGFSYGVTLISASQPAPRLNDASRKNHNGT